MTSTEKRAMDLAAKIVAAVQAVDTPNRNARAMLTDASMWTAVATAIVNVVEGNDGAEPEAEAGEASEATGSDENGDTGRRRRRREA